MVCKLHMYLRRLLLSSHLYPVTNICTYIYICEKRNLGGWGRKGKEKKGAGVGEKES